MAVSKHFKETRTDEKQRQVEYMSMCNRLNGFTEFLRKNLNTKDPKMEKFVRREDDEISISGALFEAAATTRIGTRGFRRDSLFAVANKLLAEENR